MNTDTKTYVISTNMLMTVLCFFFVVLSGMSMAQNVIFDNPFETDNPNFSSEELFVVWDNPDDNASINQQIRSFDLEAFLLGGDVFPAVTDVTTLETNQLNNNDRVMTTSANLDGDEVEDLVVLFENSGWNLYVVQNEVGFDEETLSGTFSLGSSINADWLEANTGNLEKQYIPRLHASDVDGDGTDEIIVAYKDLADDHVHIQIYDTDGSLILNERGYINDEISVFGNTDADAYDISTADLNNDGSKEILLSGLEENGVDDSGYSMYIKIYDVPNEGSLDIDAKNKTTVNDNFSLGADIQPDYIRTAIEGVSVDGNADRFVVTFMFTDWVDDDEFPNNSDPNSYVYFIEADEDLQGITVLDTYADNEDFHEDYQFGAYEVNLDGDYPYEILINYGSLQIFTVDGDNIQQVANGTGGSGNTTTLQSLDCVTFGDVDLDGRQEMITLEAQYNTDDWNHIFTAKIFGIQDDPELGEYVVSTGDFHSWEEDGSFDEFRSFAIAAGNLDGLDWKIGEGVMSECEYYQPVMRIGAIPTHFDVIDGVAYDLASCYDGSCSMVASYQDTDANTVSNEMTYNSDWAVGATLEAGGSYAGATVKASLTGKYGEKFANTNTQQFNTSQSITSSTTVDDKIMTFRFPLVVWEYPVLNLSDDTVSWIVGAFPHFDGTQVLSIQSSKSLFTEIPLHEVGNLLSYPNYDDYIYFPDFPTEEEAFEGNPIILGDNIEWGVNSDGAGLHIINFGASFGQQQSDQWTGHLSAEVSASGFGVGAKLSGEYNVGGLKIHKQNVQSTKQFKFEISQLTGSASGEYDYSITPKIYWNRGGSGVVTYNVNPLVSAGSGTFWEDHYTSKPDPAIILPWRHDPVHSNLDPNDPKVDRTKSMFFDNYSPIEEDIVTVALNVLNYSLLDMEQEIEVSFFVGHPDNGNIIESIDGETVFSTENILEARGREYIQMQFEFTSDMANESLLKIYAQLDPNGLIDEIHEDNNTGWALLGFLCNDPTDPSLGLADYHPSALQDFGVKVYPNPAKHNLTLEFYMGTSEDTQIDVLDMQGRKVKKVFSGNLHPSEYQITTDISDISSGIYLVKVSSVGQTATAKFVVE